ncbi:STK17B [Symbiodinium natans]|uniref:STK17B protein n=1 Tax=Symbiodinium natans TaxID=878477 RepID=A0A812SH91_9DINO|nr:STK17B [Symbiodinium natans]
MEVSTAASLNISPHTSAHDSYIWDEEDEAAIATCLSSPREVAGGELPMYLSGEHFLGSGVTPLRYSQAQELLNILMHTPSIAVNPAYVAKLKGSSLFTEAGRCDVTVPLILSSVTVSPKANARGQFAIIVREHTGCFNLPTCVDRCWLFQMDARQRIVSSTIEKLCAAGAVLESTVNPAQLRQVSDTSRALVYMAPLVPLLQDGEHESEAGESSRGPANARAVKVFKAQVLEARGAGPSASADEPPKDVARELKMLALAQKHRAILSLHGLARVPTGWALLTEWCEGGCLLRHLTAGRQSESQASLLEKQLLAGIGHLHQRGIVHRDVKLENILLRSRSRLALSGFALAAPLCEACEATEPVGTVGYMAPEVIRYAPALEPADVFAAGVVLYTLLLGRQPFGGETPAEETKYRTTCTEADYTGLIFQNVSGLCQRLLQSLLEKDPVERPKAVAAAQDDWFFMDPTKPLRDVEACDPWHAW